MNRPGSGDLMQRCHATAHLTRMNSSKCRATTGLCGDAVLQADIDAGAER